MPDINRYRVADLTRDEFAQAMRAGRWLLLPFGSVEQHGPHLPLGTDLFYGEHVCLAVAEQVNGLVAPGFPYGICRTMRNFPGTVSLSPETFTPMLREVLAEYIRHDARKFALIAGHAEEAQNGAMREAVGAHLAGNRPRAERAHAVVAQRYDAARTLPLHAALAAETAGRA